jgi:hypothetical protein
MQKRYLHELNEKLRIDCFITDVASVIKYCSYFTSHPSVQTGITNYCLHRKIVYEKIGFVKCTKTELSSVGYMDSPCTVKPSWRSDFMVNCTRGYITENSLHRTALHCVTPRRSVLLEKLTVPPSVRIFPAFRSTLVFITVFTTARRLSLTSARLIQCTPSYPVSFRSIYEEYFHLHI